MLIVNMLQFRFLQNHFASTINVFHVSPQKNNTYRRRDFAGELYYCAEINSWTAKKVHHTPAKPILYV